MSSSLLEGRVGRIYLPKQQIMSMPQHKMKVRSSLPSEDRSKHSIDVFQQHRQMLNVFVSGVLRK